MSVPSYPLQLNSESLLTKLHTTSWQPVVSSACRKSVYSTHEVSTQLDVTATEVEYPYRLLLSILRPAFGTFIPESQAVIVLPEVTLERAKVEVCAVTVFAFMAPNAAGASNAGTSNAGTSNAGTSNAEAQGYRREAQNRREA